MANETVKPTVATARRVTNATCWVERQARRRETADYGTRPRGATAAASDEGAFLVYLTQNGGANGDDGSTTTACFSTYTYDVYADAAKTQKIGTVVGVLWHRPLQVQVTPAGHGLAQWVGGTLVLIQVDEYADQGDCP